MKGADPAATTVSVTGLLFVTVLLAGCVATVGGTHVADTFTLAMALSTVLH